MACSHGQRGKQLLQRYIEYVHVHIIAVMELLVDKASVQAFRSFVAYWRAFHIFIAGR